jgi:hypothetical protein
MQDYTELEVFVFEAVPGTATTPQSSVEMAGVPIVIWQTKGPIL